MAGNLPSMAPFLAMTANDRYLAISSEALVIVGLSNEFGMK